MPARLGQALGSASRNDLLNDLTAQATGLPVERGSVESTTLGNFAVQLARLSQTPDGPSAAAISEQASRLAAAPFES